ncbi:MAG: isoprenylcysteine carboxylmethyltransferase family protein [Steroidobacteraceae bacterium]
MAISELFSPNLLGPVFGLSEFALLLGKRSGSGATSADRGSLRLLWGVIGLCVVLAILAGNLVPQANSSWLWRLRTAGGVLFLLGLLLRWYAIITLGRFFTVNVAIAADHRVIDTGPYRLVRHPSYSGSLLQFVGLGITFGNWLSLALLVLPVLAVYQRRIAIEEQALSQGLGDPYRRYMAQTRRLIPGIY